MHMCMFYMCNMCMCMCMFSSPPIAMLGARTSGGTRSDGLRGIDRAPLGAFARPAR